MLFIIVVGSHRQVSNSTKISLLIQEIISIQNSEITIEKIDLDKNPLPI